MIRNSYNKKIIHCNLMQAFVSTAHNENAAVVIHNTRSCSSIALRAYFGLRERASGADTVKLGSGNNLFCTALTDKDAVFGGGEKLEQCLLDICRVRNPEYILVACGCVPGVVGDDTEAICKTVREKTGVPILLLPGAGFMVPGLLDMVLAATDLLCKEFTYPLAGQVKRRDDTAVVIGLSNYYISRSVFEELRESLTDLGISVIYCPPVGETKKEYQEMASASLAISLCMGVVQKEAGRKLAEEFAGKLQIPLLDMNASYEPADTVKILRIAGEKHKLGNDYDKKVDEKIKMFEQERQKAAALLHGRSCLIAAGLPFRFFMPLGTIRFLESLGLSVTGFLLPETATAAKENEADAFIKEHNLKMRCFRQDSVKESDADILVTAMPLQTTLKQFVFQSQHFSLEGWCREIHRLTGLISG